ncbi:MAG: DUF177 domain-containing protein [Candidatus Omnitrophica bacterium]|jgi:uncharacterized protein|nr:DUF177 domain-containing protein [Candidatus Omnitrophota bacterium]
MKINIHQIPQDGIYIEEKIDPRHWELDAAHVRFTGDVLLKAHLNKITNAISAKISVSGKALMTCGRCLGDYRVSLNKDFQLDFPVDEKEQFLVLDDKIRDEIIIDFPIKPLCKENCKGLCVSCGVNLNENKCNCR